MNLFQKTLQKKNTDRPPVWFMRQAGRYHSHYQGLRKRYGFIDLCKIPEVACEVTMGPIRDFGFDAAILFSDLLFPLEAMGMGLKYDPAPALDWYLKSPRDLSRLKGGKAKASHMDFQAEALHLIRRELSTEKGLIGFVGGPWTLFCYAVDGSHKGELKDSKAGLLDGRWEGFLEQFEELIIENMGIQAQAGIDTIAMMDTCAGDLSASEYAKYVMPSLRRILTAFTEKFPKTPVTLYTKGTSFEYWSLFDSLPVAAIGVDWKTPIHQVLSQLSDRFVIQGNVDPEWLFLDPKTLESRLREVFQTAKALPAQQRQGWICGLGHGVLPGTPEDNVRLFLKLQKEVFG